MKTIETKIVLEGNLSNMSCDCGECVVTRPPGRRYDILWSCDEHKWVLDKSNSNLKNAIKDLFKK